MDAWWPLLVRGAFEPVLGKDAYERFIGFKNLDNEPNNHGAHLGSAYQGGTYGLVQKDLRTLLGRKRLEAAEAPAAQAGALLAHLLRRHQAPARHAAPLPRGAGVARWCRRSARRPASCTASDEICESQPGLGPIRPAPQGRRPVVLRLDLDARARRRAAAGDPLDQPADLPAGGGDPGPCASLGTLADRRWLVLAAGAAVSAGHARA